MSRKKAKHPIFLIFLTFLAVFLVVVVIVQLKAKTLVEDFLERKLPAHVELDYQDMDVNVWKGTIGLEDISIRLFDRDSVLMNTEVSMQAITLHGLSYWQFFVNQHIAVDELKLRQPQIDHYLHKVLPKENDDPQGVVQLLKTIEIKVLKVSDGRLKLFQEGKDSIAFQTEAINFNLMEAQTGPEKIKEKIPIIYSSYNLASENLFVDLGPFEELKVDAISLKNGNAGIKNLDLHSKFDKAKLSEEIKTQHDHISLKIPEITLDSIQVGFRKDSLFIVTGLGNINGPKAEIFRDKLVTEDRTHKRLYSEMLRELPIHIDIPKVKVADGNLVYSEQVETIVAPGEITFNDINATLQNITNKSQNGNKTRVSIDAKLMNHAPIDLDWSFDVSKENDPFTASGVIKNFKTSSINDFLESNLRARAKGTIDRMYFTVSGNVISSAGDMKMKYDDFEFSVLKKNKLGVNKLLTFLGNIFINDGSRADEDGFRYGSIEVERDPTKSFFNYLWLNVREGTVNTLVSKGK